MVRLMLAALAAVWLAAAPTGAEGPAPCAAAAGAGKCFAVRGRVTACNGVPTVRIWIVGTQRILGVADGRGNPAGEHVLPVPLEQTLLEATPCSKAAFADLTVCPLSPVRPGVMQRVCVVSADRVTVLDDW